jgi:hypothetical protein
MRQQIPPLMSVGLLTLLACSTDSRNSQDLMPKFMEEWWLSEPLRVEREFATAVPIDEDSFLVVGGATRDRTPLSAIELVHVWERTSEVVAELKHGREHPLCAKLADDRWLVIGGTKSAETEIIDISQRKVEAGPRLAIPRESFFVGVGLKDVVVVIGGWDEAKQEEMSDVEVINLRNLTVSRGASLPFPSAGSCAVAISPHEIMVCGGARGPDPLANCAIYDILGDRWIHAPPLRVPRYQHTLELVGDSVVAIGGVGPDGRLLSSCERLSLTSRNRWESINDHPTPVWLHTSCTINGCIIVVGGRDDSPRPRRGVSMLHVREGKWKSLPDLKIPRVGAVAVTLRDGICVIGGSQDSMLEYPAEVYAKSFEFLPLSR